MFTISSFVIHANIQRASNKVMDASNLHHLRRFVKPEQLPLYLKEVSPLSNMTRVSANGREVNTGGEVDLVDCKDGEVEHKKPEVFSNEHKQPMVHFLLCLKSNISSDFALELLASLDVPPMKALQPQLQTISVPLLPPRSEDQASRWSQDFWPTVYKKHNPFGPHPSIVSRAEDEMRAFSEEWMSLAECAGVDVSENAIGEPIGAVVVDRNSPQGPSVVVVAGDARWHRTSEKNGSGNVLAHAVMRAIGLIARKRRALLGEPIQDGTESDASSFFEDQPLTPVEIDQYSRDTLAPGGYLCLGLDIYVTHEPCTMCSMAILHSRFGRIIFRELLPQTGGLVVEQGEGIVDASTNTASLNYGLFWRPELNWKLLAWQWQWHNTDRAPLKLSGPNIHA